MTDRLLTTESLHGGEVVQVAVELTDKQTGNPFWWRRFGFVRRVRSTRFAEIVSLKLEIDPFKDIREVDFGKDVVTLVPEERMPQGVAAMLMKHLALGTIKAGGGA